jgi:class I fructose-bisphosphate aldolase
MRTIVLHFWLALDGKTDFSRFFKEDGVNVGKRIRLNRLFAHKSGKFFSVAVDHFSGYSLGLPPSLQKMTATLAQIVEGGPDAVTMHIGVACNAWVPYAGSIPLILQSTIGRPDDSQYEVLVTPEDAVRVGADGYAIAVYVRGRTEGEYLGVLAAQVKTASRFEMPVICHIYPRSFTDKGVEISFTPEDIAWAVHCAFECGADVIKVPYCGNERAYAEIVADCPVPVVAAGGPQQENLASALTMIRDVIRSGAKGATVGRNVWGFEGIAKSIGAFKAVVHDGVSPAEALRTIGR